MKEEEKQKTPLQELTEQKEQLRKEFIDYYVNSRESQSMLDSLDKLFNKYYSKLESKDAEITLLKDLLKTNEDAENKKLTEQLKASKKRINDLLPKDCIQGKDEVKFCTIRQGDGGECQWCKNDL